MCLEWRRLLRRRTLWTAAFVALLPVIIPVVQKDRGAWLDAIGAICAALAVCAPLLVTSLVADDIVDKTASYLFTRPLSRRLLFLAKVCAGMPPLLLLMTVPVTISFFIANQGPMELLDEYTFALLGVSLGAMGTATVAGAWGAIFPKRALPAAIGYLFLLDALLAAIPFSINEVSMIRHAVRIAEGDLFLRPAASLLVLSSIWLAIGLWRFRPRAL